MLQERGRVLPVCAAFAACTAKLAAQRIFPAAAACNAACSGNSNQLQLHARAHPLSMFAILCAWLHALARHALLHCMFVLQQQASAFRTGHVRKRLLLCTVLYISIPLLQWHQCIQCMC
jgi:hypothetical protein